MYMLRREPSEVLRVDLTLSLWTPVTSMRSLTPGLNALKAPTLRCVTHELQLLCLNFSYLYQPLDFPGLQYGCSVPRKVRPLVLKCSDVDLGPRCSKATA